VTNLVELLEARLDVPAERRHFRGDGEAVIYVDGLEGVYFALRTYPEYPAGLMIEIDLPEVPEDDPRYEEWWENPVNRRFPEGEVVNNWADVGAFLERVEMCQPITIEPWPEDQAEPTHPAEKAGGGMKVLYTVDAVAEWLERGWSFVGTLISGDGHSEPGAFVVYRHDAAETSQVESLSKMLAQVGDQLVTKERALIFAEDTLTMVDEDLGEAIGLLKSTLDNNQVRILDPKLLRSMMEFLKRMGEEREWEEPTETNPAKLREAEGLLNRVLNEIGEDWEINPHLWRAIRLYFEKQVVQVSFDGVQVSGETTDFEAAMQEPDIEVTADDY